MAKESEIYLYDEVFFGSAGDFISQIRAAGTKPLALHINSPGGSVFDGYAIYNALLGHAPGVTVYIDGLCASIASYIALAGTKVIMAENAMLMIHNPTTGLYEGDAADMRKQADILDKITASMVAAYARRSNQSPEQITAMMDEETWLTSEMALAMGFADEVSPALKMAAHFDISKFKNAPKNIMTLDPDSSSSSSSSLESDPALFVKTEDEGRGGEGVDVIEAGWTDKVMAFVKSKAELVATIAGLESKIEVRDASIANLNQQVVALNATIAAQKIGLEEVAKLKTAITTLEANEKTVAQAAVDQLSALGFEASKLPAANVEAEDNSDAALYDKFQSADPTESRKMMLDPVINARLKAESLRRNPPAKTTP